MNLDHWMEERQDGYPIGSICRAELYTMNGNRAGSALVRILGPLIRTDDIGVETGGIQPDGSRGAEIPSRIVQKVEFLEIDNPDWEFLVGFDGEFWLPFQELTLQELPHDT